MITMMAFDKAWNLLKGNHPGTYRYPNMAPDEAMDQWIDDETSDDGERPPTDWKGPCEVCGSYFIFTSPNPKQCPKCWEEENGKMTWEQRFNPQESGQ